MSHPALDKAWAWFEKSQGDLSYDRREAIHRTLSELEVELHRIDQAQYVPAAPVQTEETRTT